MQDELIVELYWQRNEDAISQTQKKYEKLLISIAHNILYNNEDCKESVNDTYLAAWNSMPPNKPNVLSAYLCKITRRISIDIFRKKNREKRKASEYSLSLDELDECLSSTSTTEHEYEEKQLTYAINEFLHTLSDEAKNLFIGRYYFLDPLKKVAQYCNLSESNAKTILYRTRLALKEYLKKEGFEI